MVLPNLVVPSIPYLTYSLFRFLSNHPLLVHPHVKHPLTGESVEIAAYRFMDGFPLEEGVVCSIYPAFGTTSGAPMSPTTTSASVLYRPHNLGNNHNDVFYHFVVRFTIREVMVDSLYPSKDKDLITVPTDALVDPKQRMLVKTGTREVPVYINPSMDIIGDYLELTRLAIEDVAHRDAFPVHVNSMEVVHCNYETSLWNENTNSVVQTGYLYIRMNAFVSRGWKDKFVVPLEKVNLTLDQETASGQLTAKDAGFREDVYGILGNVLEPGGNNIPKTEKGQPLGVATLDEFGKINNNQLPLSLEDPQAAIDASLQRHTNDINAHPQYALVEHNHSISSISGLADALASKQEHSEVLDSLEQVTPSAGWLLSNGVSILTVDSMDGGTF